MAVAFHPSSLTCSSVSLRRRPPAATPVVPHPQHCLRSVQQRAGHVSRLAAVRQPKDPSSFKSMDELREYLERGEDSGVNNGFISGVINALSNSSFGGAGSTGRQPWWSRVYRWFTSGLQPPRFMGEGDESPELAAVVIGLHERLGPVLLLPRHRIRRLVRKYPQVSRLSSADITERVLALKMELPGADAVRLIEDQPALFLSGTAAEMRAHVSSAVTRLREGLQGASVTAVVMSEPTLLYLDLEHGLKELRDLWDVDAQALDNSEPHELAFAVKSLCLTTTRQPHEWLVHGGYAPQKAGGITDKVDPLHL